MTATDSAPQRAITSFCVALNVTDLDRSVGFYALLGLQETTRFSPMSGIDEAVLLSPGSPGPSLLLVRSEGRSEKPTLGTGLSRLVAFVEDLAAKCTLIERAHWKVDGLRTLDSGIKVAFATDPDGYPVEMVQVST